MDISKQYSEQGLKLDFGFALGVTKTLCSAVGMTDKEGAKDGDQNVLPGGLSRVPPVFPEAVYLQCGESKQGGGSFKLYGW